MKRKLTKQKYNKYLKQMKRNEKPYCTRTYLQKIHTGSTWSKWQLANLKLIAQELRLIDKYETVKCHDYVGKTYHLEWKAGNR